MELDPGSTAASPGIRSISCTADCGLIVNPASVEAQLQGGIFMALSAALPPKSQVKIDLDEVDIKLNKVSIRKASSAPVGDTNALRGIELLEENLKKSECFKKYSDPDKKSGPEDTRLFSMTLEVGC